MAHKIINKFKEPKYAEFSRKDLVIDIKNGVLYYKSNLGVHKISSGLATDTFGSGDITNITNFNVGIPDTFKGDGIRVGDSSITGTLTITEDSIIIGDTTIEGDITIGGDTTITGSIVINQSASFGNVIPNPGLNVNAVVSPTTASNNQIIGPATFFEAGDLVNISTGSYNQTVRIEDINGATSMSINTTWAGPLTGSFIYNVDPNLFVVKASDGKTELKLDNRGNLDIDGGLTANLSSATRTKIVFYDDATGIFTHQSASLIGGGILSSSNQISTAISGAFDSVSASLATNILAASDTFKTTGTRTGDAFITGSLTVTDRITAQEFHTEFISSSVIFESGSTQFGNSSDDTHTFSGSINVVSEGHITASGNISASGKIYAGLSNTNNTNLVFYNPTTGELTQQISSSLLTGLISSSSQIATDISGALGPNATLIRSLTAAGISGSFTTLSSSLSSSIATNTTNITSLTSATSSYTLNSQTSSFAPTSATASYVQNSATSSFLLNTTDTLTGDLLVTNNITASGIITASNLSGINTGDQDLSSYIQNSQTSSFAPTSATASYTLNSQTSSFVPTSATASYTLNSQTSSFAPTSATASYVQNSATSSFLLNTTDTLTGDLTVTNHITASGNITASNLSGINTGDQDLSSYIQNSQTSSFAPTSATSSYTLNSQTSSFAPTSATASYVQNSATSSYTLNSQTSSFAPTSATASYVQNSATSSFLLNTTDTLTGDLTVTNHITASGIITASNLSGTNTGDQNLSSYIQNSQTSSFALTSATSSYTLNSQTSSFAPTSATASYVQNSATSSYTLNSQTSSFAPTSATASYVQNSATGSFLLNTTDTLTGDLTVTNHITASGIITASNLSGINTGDQDLSSYIQNSVTSSFALTSATSSYTLNSQTSSFALTSATASYVQNSATSSYTLNSQTSSFAPTSATASYVQNSATSSFLLNTTDTLTGDLTVTGTITAQEFHTEFISASIIFESGSTQFGNSSDDIHTFSGSINVKDDGHITASGNISSSGTGDNFFNGDFKFDGDTNITTIGASDDLSINPAAELNLGTSNADVVQIGRQTGAIPVKIFAGSSTPTFEAKSGHITASGNISSSGELSISSIKGNNPLTIYSDFTNRGRIDLFNSSAGNAAQVKLYGGSAGLELQRNTGVVLTGDLTASGNISASGRVYGTHFGTGNANRNAIDFGTNNTLQFRLNDGSRITHTPTIFRPSTDEAVSLGRTANKWKELVVKNITASNDISASGNLFISASDSGNVEFKTLMYDTSTGKIFHTGSYGGGAGGEFTAVGISGSFTVLSSSLSSSIATNTTSITSLTSATSSYTLNSQTSSFALTSATSSYTLNSQTSSFALTSATASYVQNSATGSFLLNTTDTLTGDLLVTNNITASGNISASGTIFGTKLVIDNFTSIETVTNTGRLFEDGDLTTIEVGRSNTPNKNISLFGPITASGDISASNGFIIGAHGDFNSTLRVDGSDISLDSTGTLNIDNSSVVNGITIGTQTSGVPISIGHATSITNINDDLIVTGDITGSNKLLIQKSSGQGTPLAGTSDIAIFQNNSSGQDASIAIIAANTHKSQLHFGHSSSIDQGSIKYLHHGNVSGPDKMVFRISGSNVITFSNPPSLGSSKGAIGIGGDHNYPTNYFHAQGVLSGEGLMLSSSNGTGITIDRGTNNSLGTLKFNTDQTTDWTLGNINGDNDNNFYIYNGDSTGDKHISLTPTSTTFHTNITSSGNITASNLSGTNTGDQDLSSYIQNSQTSSFAPTSATSSYTLNSQTSSFAPTSATASYVQNSATSSFALSSQTGSFLLNTTDTLTGDLTVTGDIIAQRYIVSSSVTHLTSSFSSGSTIFGDTTDDTHQFVGNITASGNVSSSGNITAANVFLPGQGKISFDDSLDGTDQFIQGNDHNITIDGDNQVNINADVLINLNQIVSASTNIHVPHGSIFDGLAKEAKKTEQALSLSGSSTGLNTGGLSFQKEVAVGVAEATLANSFFDGSNRYLIKLNLENLEDLETLIVTDAQADRFHANQYFIGVKTGSAAHNTKKTNLESIFQAIAGTHLSYDSARSKIDVVPFSGTISSSATGTSQGQIKFNNVDVNVKDLQTTSNPTFNHITASGDISASGTIQGNVSSSGQIIGQSILVDNNQKIQGKATGGGSRDLVHINNGNTVILGSTSTKSRIRSNSDGIQIGGGSIQMDDNVILIPGKKLQVENSEILLTGSAQIRFDLIDNEISINNLYGQGEITASGAISASGELFAGLTNSNNKNIVYYDDSTGELTYELSSSLTPSNTFKSTGVRTGDGFIDGNITASNNISASGILYADNLIVRTINIDGANINYNSLDDILRFGDNVTLGIGTGPTSGVSDTNLIHDGSNFWLRTITGNAKIDSYEGDIILNPINSSKGVIISGSTPSTFLDVRGNITASGDISASGLLFASSSDAAGNPYLTVLVDTGSGRFYYTGSYGGGGGGGGSDNLGNHTATQTLDMDGFSISASKNIEVQDNIYHDGDLNTKITFTNDQIDFVAGGVTMLTLDEATNDSITFNQNANDVNFRIESSNKPHMFFVDSGNDKVGIGSNAPRQLLEVSGSNPQIAIVESPSEFVRIGVEQTGGDMFLGWDDSDDFHFGVFSSPTDSSIDTKMLIKSGGSVSIGTTQSPKKLTVAGGVSASGFFDNGVLLTNNTSLTAGTSIGITNNNTTSPTITVEPGGNTGNILIVNRESSADEMVVDTGLTFFSSTLETSGTDTLSVAGDIIAFASDKRLKENIVEISDPIKKIQQLRGVTYDWKDKALDLGFTTARQYNEIGLIAQELEKVIPQAVTRAPFDNEHNKKIYVLGNRIDGETEPYKTIKMDKVVPLLIEGIKNQQKQIDELKEMIVKLSNKN